MDGKEQEELGRMVWDIQAEQFKRAWKTEGYPEVNFVQYDNLSLKEKAYLIEIGERLFQAGQLAEREACAKLLERWDIGESMEPAQVVEFLEELAQRIRDRSKP